MSEPMDDLDASFISIDEVENRGGFGRQAKRVAARAGEAIVGLPGDMQMFAGSLGEAIGGRLGRGAARLMGREPAMGEPELPQAMIQLPTSQDVREGITQRLTGEELEPQSRAEMIADEVVQDFATLAIPVKGKPPFAKALGTAILGNLGKEAVMDLGGSAAQQGATKLGLMTFAGMFGKGRGIRTHINKLYDQAESFVPREARVAYDPSGLRKLETQLRKGVVNEAKEPALNFVNQVQRKTRDGQVNVQEMIQFDKDLNRAIGRARNDKALRGNLMQVKKQTNKILDAYGKENPSWKSTFDEAKQAYAGVETSLRVQDYIKRNADLKNLSHAGILLGLAEQVVPFSGMTQLATGAAASGLAYGGVVASRLATNPALRRYYQNVVQASLNENKGALARNLAGLEREAKKELQNNPFPVFDLEEEDEEEF